MLQDGAPRSEISLLDTDILKQRFGDFDDVFTEQRRTLIALSVLDRERDDNDYATLLAGLEEGLESLVKSRNFDLLENILATLGRHSREDSGRSPRQRRLALDAIDQLRSPTMYQALVAWIANGAADTVHLAAHVIDGLGPSCIPELLQGLRRPSGAYRARLARILAGMKNLSPRWFMQKKLDSTCSNYCRNLIWLLGELDRTNLTALLLEMAGHENETIRPGGRLGACPCAR